MEKSSAVKRLDAWSTKDDRILSETVMNCISLGRTQLEGFKRASVILKRSTNACGFRWNNFLRKQLSSEIHQAKAQSKLLKNERKTKNSVHELPHNENILLTEFQTLVAGIHDGIDQLCTKMTELTKENSTLRAELASRPSPLDIAQMSISEIIARSKEFGLGN
jgi:RsfA family transcription factor